MDWESTYLDLKKDILNISYFNFANKKEEEKGNYENYQQDIKTEDLVANTFLFFEEKKIILNDLQNLCFYVYYKTGLINKEEFKKHEKDIENFPFFDIVNRIMYTMYKYIEQPGLLDNIIGEFVNKIMGLFKIFIHDCYVNNKDFIIGKEINKILYVLYALQKVRGSDNIKKYFPHEAKDLCPLIMVLYMNRNNEKLTWESRIVLMLWLSILLLMPFDLKKLDSEKLSIIENQEILDLSNWNSRIIRSIINLLIPNILNTNKYTEITGKAISILLSRPDVKILNLYKIFIDFCLKKFNSIEDEIKDVFIISNLYKTLSFVCEKLNSNDLKPYIDTFFNLIDEENYSNNNISKIVNNNSNVRKNKTKFICNFIIKHLGNVKNYWFYYKKKIDLENNLKGNVVEDDNELITNTNVFEKEFFNLKNNINENEVEISEEILMKIEDLIEFLIKRLMDNENKIRWATAKLVAKITMRLDKKLAYDIIDFILDISENKTEQSYHGVCLSIGEFIKRGLIQPEFLEKISKILLEALSFEHLNIGGSLVRDSACYVIWALARIYDKSVIEKYFPKIDTDILKLALFDKEGNCRKAAAACFQEHVGRVKGYKDGIAIISETDYFSVGSVINSYLKVACFVTHFDQYTEEFINYLGKEKVFHEDKTIRKLSSSSLSILISLKPEISIELIDYLISKIDTKIFTKRHGILLALSHILIGITGKSCDNFMEKKLHKNSIFMKTLTTNEKKLMLGGENMEIFEKKFESIRNKNNSNIINEELKLKILNIPKLVISKNYLKGKGIDTISESLQKLIFSISVCFDNIDNNSYKCFFEILLEGCKHKLEEYQLEAIKSTTKFMLKYRDLDYEYEKNQLNFILKKLKTESSMYIRRGFIQLLPYFSDKIKEECIEEIFSTIALNLENNIKINKNSDPETRRNGILSLYKILKYTPTLNLEYMDKIVKLVLKGLEDYSRDNRGDIGSIVREQSIHCIYKILNIIVNLNNKEEIFKLINFDEIFGNIIQQLSEQIDRVRLTAGSYMQLIVDNLFEKLPDFKTKSIIQEYFNMNYLKIKFEEEKNKVYKNFDISLIDDSKFISYKNNKNFIYFWSIAHCNFSIIFNLIKNNDLRYFIIKGICKSYGSLTEDTQKEAQVCLSNYFNIIKNDKEKIMNLLDIFITLLSLYRRKLIFITPLLKTIDLFFKTEDLLDEWDEKEINDKNLQILELLYKESRNSKQIKKLTSICVLLNSLLLKVEFEDKKEFLDKTSSIFELLLFHEFPIVSKEMVDNLYIFLTLKGELFFEDEKQFEEILSLLDSEKWKESDISELKKEFKWKFV